MQRPVTSQIVIDEFARIVDAQDKKGFKKYSTTIDEAKDENYDWKLMALEETADLQKYLVKEISLLQLYNQYLLKELVGAKTEITRQQKEIAGYIVDTEEMEGMLAQANNQLKELESNRPIIKKPNYMDLDD